MLTDARESARNRLLRKRLNGVSYEHPLAFWLGSALTIAGAGMQLPMYYMARGMHYHLAGMPVTNEMLVGMGMMFLGLAVTIYGVFPRSQPTRPELSRVSITPLDDAETLTSARELADYFEKTAALAPPKLAANWE